METIQVRDLKFVPMIKSDEIQKQVKRVAGEINRDLKGETPIFLSVLNGAFMFMADLMREIELDCEVSFVRFASYQGTKSTGKVKELVGLNEDIEGRVVVIVEDIIDSGITMEHLLATLKKHNPKEIRVCSLLVKPDNLKVKLDIPYIAFNIPNDFILGYGLDYDGIARNLRDIYVLKED